MTAAARTRQPDPSPKMPTVKKPADNPVARFRPNELQRLRCERYGNVITPDDDGWTLVTATLDCFALSTGADQRMMNFLVLHCPWMSPEDRENAKQAALRGNRFWSPSALGDALKLTWPEREKLRITTFRAAGVGDDEMVATRKAREAARKQAKRIYERLRPAPKPSKPSLRLEAIAEILPAGEWVSVTAICAELKRSRGIHFASLTGATLTAAVHDAIKLGVKAMTLEKQVVPGPKPNISVAEIRRRKPR